MDAQKPIIPRSFSCLRCPKKAQEMGRYVGPSLFTYVPSRRSCFLGGRRCDPNPINFSFSRYFFPGECVGVARRFFFLMQICLSPLPHLFFFLVYLAVWHESVGTFSFVSLIWAPRKINTFFAHQTESGRIKKPLRVVHVYDYATLFSTEQEKYPVTTKVLLFRLAPKRLAKKQHRQMPDLEQSKLNRVGKSEKQFQSSHTHQ